MFNLNYEGRLSRWREFREGLENSPNAVDDVVRFYRLAPTVSIHTDPYNNKTWPGPWELLHENQYCSFCKILGMCYTLQLTESFKEKTFEIIIGRDIDCNKRMYLLSIDNNIIGIDDNYLHVDELPESVIIERNYSMPELQ
tara:strand:+ start:2481 stop:2903 length:423 start_codon:yes stop_codon:yes gene_type:complete